MAVVGMLLAFLLVALGVGTALRQRRTLARLRADRFLPSDDRAYLRGQVIRRVLVAASLVGVGGLIGGYYVSGLDDRVSQIAERKQHADPNPPRPADPAGQQAERDFARFVGLYWVGVLGLVFVVGCLAVFDFWATRRYWLVQYRLIKADHEVKLRRDLAVYRQTKDNDRLGRINGGKPDDGSGDDTGEHPPAG